LRLLCSFLTFVILPLRSPAAFTLSFPSSPPLSSPPSFPTRRSSDLHRTRVPEPRPLHLAVTDPLRAAANQDQRTLNREEPPNALDRKSTRLNSSHVSISYAVFCLKKKKQKNEPTSKRRKHRHKRTTQ